jgi:hypothetical protein
MKKLNKNSLYRRCKPQFHKQRLVTTTTSARAQQIHESQVDLLEWANTALRREVNKVRVTSVPGSSSRGLVAACELEPGETILSVPLDKVFMSEPVADMVMYWAADMAVRLLRELDNEKHEGSFQKVSVHPVGVI